MTPLLGDHFSDEYKWQFIKDNLKVGSVIKFYCNIAEKEKRFVIIGEKYDKKVFALLYINTEINLYFNPTPELQALHLPLHCNEDRPYIDHDCFVACNALIPYSYDYLAGLMFNKIDIYLGTVIHTDLKNMMLLVKTAKTIRPREKKDFGLFL